MLGQFFALLASVIWGFATLCNRYGLRKTDPYVGTVFSLLVGYSGFCLFSALLRPMELEFIFSIDFVIIGLTFCTGFLFNFFAIDKIGVARSVSLSNSMRPIVAGLLSMMLLREVLTVNLALGALLIVAGVYIITVKKKSRKIGSGESLAILASMSWGFGGVFIRKVLTRNVSIFTLLYTSVLLGLILISVALAIMGKLNPRTIKSLDRSAFLFLGFGGLGAVFGTLSLYASLNLVSVLVAYSLSNLSPFFAIALAAIFLREAITPKLIIGSITIFIGALLVSI